MHHWLALLLCTVLFGTQLPGCSSVNKTVDRSLEVTTGAYKKYINRDPSVDLEQGVGCSSDEFTAARTFMPVDSELGRLVRVQFDKDTYPPENWMGMVLDQFTWLNGVMVTDTQGDVLAKRPSASIKSPDMQLVLKQDIAWTHGTIHWFLQENDLGPEFVLVSPFFKDNEWQGLIVSHFDFRSLAGLSPNPQSMMAFSPGSMLWTGRHSDLEAEILSRDWDGLLKDKVQGRLELDNGSFLWLTRYIGEKPLIYAVKCMGEE